MPPEKINSIMTIILLAFICALAVMFMIHTAHKNDLMLKEYHEICDRTDSGFACKDADDILSAPEGDK